MLMVGGRLYDDADRSARIKDEATRARDVHKGHHLRAYGENQVGMVMHAIAHVETVLYGLGNSMVQARLLLA